MQKATQTEQKIDYKVRLHAKYKMRLSNSESNNVDKDNLLLFQP